MTKEYFKLKVGDGEFNIMSNETILECAYRNGIEIKYHCAAGHCGKCKVKLISGEVILNHSGGISRDNIEKGFVLACCSIPKGDIEI